MQNLMEQITPMVCVACIWQMQLMARDARWKTATTKLAPVHFVRGIKGEPKGTSAPLTAVIAMLKGLASVLHVELIRSSDAATK